MLILVCPYCKGPLKDFKDLYLCENCEKPYPLVDGIPCFAGKDPYYEGKYIETLGAPIFLTKWERTLSLCVGIRRWDCLEKWIPPNNFILDLGCGGGWDIIAQKGKVVGVDISFSSLEIARKIYPMVIQADICYLPFPDGYFDCIVAGDVLGHVPLDKKDELLGEMWRVLKAGGLVVNASIETESSDPISKICLKRPSLYKEFFIEIHGHRGYELPSQVLRRFLRTGFQILAFKKIMGFLWPAGFYHELLSNSLKETSAILNLLANYGRTMVLLHQKIDQICGLSPILRLNDIFLGPFGRILDAFLPMDWARAIGLLCRKPL